MDGVSLTGITHKKAVEFLCSAPSICKLVLERGKLSSRGGSRKNLCASPAKSPKSPDEGSRKSSETESVKRQDGGESDIVEAQIQRPVESVQLHSKKSEDREGGVDDSEDDNDLKKIKQKYYPFVTPG